MNIDTPLRQLLYVTVLVEGKNQDGQSWTGTAFLYNAAKVENLNYPILVSNRHVLAGATELTFHFIKAQDGHPQLGQRVSCTITNPETKVFSHPDTAVDLAAIGAGAILQQAFDSGQEVFFKQLDHTLIPDSETLANLDVTEEVVFIGYPSGIFDQVNLTPIIRQGITATPIQYDYNGKPAFVIDAAVFPGSSGSPVLIVNSGSYSQGSAIVVGDRILLLGAVAAVHLSSQSGVLVPTALPSVSVDIPNGLGIVYRADAIETMIDAMFDGMNLSRISPN